MSCAGCEDCTLTEIANKCLTPFEIHLTVDPSTPPPEFIRACNVMGIKPLIIANITDEYLNHSIDMMTRSTVVGTSEDAGDEIFRVAMGLKDRGFEIVRHKVETVPWAYEELKNFSKEPGVPYFETHIEIKDCDEPVDVYRIAKRYGGYVSKNMLKIDTDKGMMVTFRLAHVTEREFSDYADRMRDNLTSHGLTLGKKIVELTYFDDNKAHDSSWINS